MRLALYIKKRSLAGDARIDALREALKAGGCVLYDVRTAEDILPDTDALLSLGGDGTFLSAARIVGDSGRSSVSISAASASSRSISPMMSSPRCCPAPTLSRTVPSSVRR